MARKPTTARTFRPAGVLALVAFAVALTASAVRASCVGSTLKLLWAYPADGTQDVPTNAQFWIVTSVWGAVPKVTLNGVGLAVSTVTFGAVRIDPGTLQPNTDYDLHVDYTDAVRSPGALFDLAFRTSEQPVQAPDAAAVSGYHTSDDLNVAGCPDVLNAQDCFDTGPRKLLTLELPDAQPLGWLVQTDYLGASAVWPAHCGNPTLSLLANPLHDCFDVYAIGAGGVLGHATHYCLSEHPQATRGAFADTGTATPKEQAGDAGAPSAAKQDSSCSVTRPGGSAGDRAASALCWLVVSATPLAWRRGRRARRGGRRA